MGTTVSVGGIGLMIAGLAAIAILGIITPWVRKWSFITMGIGAVLMFLGSMIP